MPVAISFVRSAIRIAFEINCIENNRQSKKPGLYKTKILQSEVGYYLSLYSIHIPKYTPIYIVLIYTATVMIERSKFHEIDR